MFLQDPKKGKIADVEDDAVCMKNLVEKRDQYFLLRVPKAMVLLKLSYLFVVGLGFLVV
jgi:hypothetical protein